MGNIKKTFMKPLLNAIDEWELDVIRREGSLQGDENSPVRFNIPRESLKINTGGPPLPGFPLTVPQIAGSIINIRKSVKELDKNPKPGKKKIDPQTLADLKSFALETGADVIGFTPVPREWVFQDTAILYTHAIVMVMEMDKVRMDKAPDKDTAVMVHETYNALGQVSNRIAGWLREQGFSAHAGHPLSGMALYPPMAQAAGLGWWGKSGLLITPEYGPRVRLAAVFTEIENFPIYEGDDHAWVLEFCDSCRKCLRACPPEAFYDAPVFHENGLMTVLDNAKCFPYFIEYHGCSICIKVCPFNQQGYHKIKDGFLKG